MMAVDEHEITEVAQVLSALSLNLSPVPAIGAEYRYNHDGAPELFYARSDAFRALQRGVVGAPARASSARC